MRLLLLLQDVYQLHTATYAYVSASRACGAMGAVKTSAGMATVDRPHPQRNVVSRVVPMPDYNAATLR